MQWNLVRLRKAEKLSQKDMAKVIGKDFQSYGRKERDEVEFTISEMIAIHRHFGKTMDEIFLPPNCINNAKMEGKEDFTGE